MLLFKYSRKVLDSMEKLNIIGKSFSDDFTAFGNGDKSSWFIFTDKTLKQNGLFDIDNR